MKFSIVTPFYNPNPEHLIRCVASVQAQTLKNYEHLLVDDGSPASLYGYNTPKGFEEEGLPKIQTVLSVPVMRLDKNVGPGAARNHALRAATGDWILFLDSDDALYSPFVLAHLRDAIEAADDDKLDLVGFNWSREVGGPPQRKDGHWLNGPKPALVDAYLSLRMDGGATFTAIRRSMLGYLRFSEDVRYHEDLLFMYYAYKHSRRSLYLDRPLYIKRKHPQATTARTSEQHLRDFIYEWHLLSYSRKGSTPAYERGVIGVVATRIRECLRTEGLDDSTSVVACAFNEGPVRHSPLLAALKNLLPQEWRSICLDTKLNTQYALAAKQFVTSWTASPRIFTKTWSCRDLQGSLFLGPDEVRACCKRFFVDGERRGDVVLTKAPVTLHRVRKAKEELIDKINAGEPTPCDGCPFMEFKDWGPVNDKIDYLSMEQHSVCNLRCEYCDPKYYDGRVASYDVASLVGGLLDAHALDGASQIVWGGGEPTVGAEFAPLSVRFQAAGVHQRVLTNAVKHSDVLQNLLKSGDVEAVVSVDAGTPERYKALRGADQFHRVLRNLRRYAQTAGDRLTIKYILTDTNCGERELKYFASHMVGNGLIDCNFQISLDFRQDTATEAQGQAVLCLYGELIRAGAKVVFLDDLARIRLQGWTPPAVPKWRRLVERIGLVPPVLADPARYPVVSALGSDEQADLIRRSWFGSQVAVRSHHKSTRETSALPIAIAGSQAYPTIYRTIKAAGLASCLVKGLIL